MNLRSIAISKINKIKQISLLLLFFFSLSLLFLPMSATADGKAIEWLEFPVPIPEQAEFIRQDRLIWDPFLQQYPAFLGKEIWQSIDQPDRLIIVVRWSSYTAWKQIPTAKIKQTTDRFHKALGKEYPILNSKAFRTE